MSVVPFPQPAAGATLYRRELTASDLLHDCYKQIEALAAFTGVNAQGRELSNEHWSCLLAPIADRLQLAIALTDRLLEDAVFQLDARFGPASALPDAGGEPPH